MDFFVGVVDNTVDFFKSTLNKAVDFWDGLDEDRKKLYIGCAIAAVAVICVASVAFAIGKAHGRNLALEEEDF